MPHEGLNRRDFFRGTVAASVIPLGSGILSERVGAQASSYTVSQGDDEYEITPLSHEDETIETFYDYDAANDFASDTTTGIERGNVSSLFLYEGPNGLSLVVIHDQANDVGGGAADFDFEGLPSDGAWVVKDDPEDKDGDSDWHSSADSNPPSFIAWQWPDYTTDGGAYRGGLDSDFEIKITPSFNKSASHWDLTEGGVIDEWQLLSGDASEPDRHNLTMDEPVTIAPAPSEPDLSLSVENTSGSVKPGETVTIQFEVTNTGGGTAIQAGIQPNLWQLPHGWEVVEQVADGGEWGESPMSDGYPFWSIEELPGGATEIPTMTLEVPANQDAGSFSFPSGAWLHSFTPSDRSRPSTDSVGITVEAQSAFENWKANKQELAGAIDDKSLLAINESDRVAPVLDGLTSKVDNGELSESVAIEGIRRKILAEQVTEDVLEYAGPGHSDLLDEDRYNIARDTAGPLLNTVVNLLLEKFALANRLKAKVGGGAIINFTIDKAVTALEDAATYVLGLMLGGAEDARSTAKSGNDDVDGCVGIATEVWSQLTDDSLGSAPAVTEAIDGLLSPLIDAVAGLLRGYIETVMATGQPGYMGLRGSLQYEDEHLNAESIQAGLEGDLESAQLAQNDGIGEISGAAHGADNVLSEIENVSGEFNVADGVVDIVYADDDADWWDIALNVAQMALNLAGGVLDAFGAGAGIGTLVRMVRVQQTTIENIVNGQAPQ